MKPPLPRSERARLAALHGYAILDSLEEPAFDDITQLASFICDTPIALISLVDSDRQWFKSRVGLQARQTPREHAFCAHAILQPHQVMVVSDATRDPRFADNPLVRGDPRIRFYAGAPLLAPSGEALGTVCVIDRVPRELGPDKAEALRSLSRLVVTQLELRRTAALLHASEERLALALAASRLAMFDWNVASAEVELSEEWTGIVGGPRQPTTTTIQALQALVHPEDAEALTSAVGKLLAGESEYYALEHRVRASDGRWRWIKSRAKVVERDAAGRALRITGTNVDVSERKAIERMKSEFISMLSHELRTPLTGIVTALALVRESARGAMAEQPRKFLDMAIENGDRLTLLLDDLLDMERLEAGRLPFEIEPVPVAAALARAIDLNAAYAGRFGVRLVQQGAAADLVVRADPDRLMQVLTNLLSNAVKYSPPGEAVVLAARAAGDAVRFAVADKGRGIPAEFRERIFERFQQVDSSDRREKGGTGLGLAISKALLERMGGRIGFDSEPGRGATFWIELPAA